MNSSASQVEDAWLLNIGMPRHSFLLGILAIIFFTTLLTINGEHWVRFQSFMVPSEFLPI